MRPPVFFLMGPTASGKTAAALSLASRFPFEVISVDSSLVYRRMDIGTAKPEAEILARVPHHLVDIREPWETYSAAEFAAAAAGLIDDIIGRGRLPLCVGGTMFYFRVLEFGLPEMPAADTRVRQRIFEEAEGLGWAAMHDRLRARDPRRAAQIGPNDRQRIQRALELLELTDRPVLQAMPEFPPRFEVHKIALAPWRRQRLHQRIEQRFTNMLARGLVEEVRDLLRIASISSKLPAMRMVGYRQVTQYLGGEVGYNEMLQNGVAATRQLAKRQLTWLRNQRGVTWIDDTTPDRAILGAYVDGILRHGGHIIGVS